MRESLFLKFFLSNRGRHEVQTYYRFCSDFSDLTKRNLLGYIQNMISSFAHKGLERFYRTGVISGIQAMHAKRLRLIFTLLDAAAAVKDMDAPGLRLHGLKGEKKDIWTVTVQANWRVTFRFKGGNAEIVNYEDYH